jgi:predicted dehydrogenase
VIILREKIGIGYIGAGFVTNTYHIPSWKNIRNAEIKAICAAHEETAKYSANICKEIGVGKPKVYTDIREMVNDPNVDAVWITTPHYFRIPIMEIIAEEVLQGKSNLIGVACEKPLARNVKEAKEMLNLVKKCGLLHGYLENYVFAPPIIKGKEVLWKKGIPIAGRPYLIRCAEEHSGPHKAWFWDGKRQGGGVLIDMICHSHESARSLIIGPEDEKKDLKPLTVSAEIACLKWTRPKYIEILKNMTKGEIDYSKSPAEDYAVSMFLYEAPDGSLCMIEATSSWCFVGPGLRMSVEVLGPEYFMQVNTLNPELFIFFSREIKGEAGKDLIEKQTADHGLMPVLPDDCYTYGFVNENRHMTESFLNEELPMENWEDGLFVIEILMASYMAAEKGKKIKFPPEGLEEYIPKVAKGEWNAKSIIEVSL